MATNQHRLIIKVIEARDLKAADFFGGTSDPYAEVRLKNQSEFGKTKVYKKSLTPNWNEEFVLHPTSLDQDVLVVKVYDWDSNSNNDILGEWECPVAAFVNKPPQDGWKPLAKRSGPSTFGPQKGEIHLNIQVIPAGATSSTPAQPPAQQPGYPPQQPGYPPQQPGYPPQQPGYPPQQPHGYPPQQPGYPPQQPGYPPQQPGYPPQQPGYPPQQPGYPPQQPGYPPQQPHGYPPQQPGYPPQQPGYPPQQPGYPPQQPHGYPPQQQQGGYHYASAPNPHAAFAPPQGVPPHVQQKMAEASTAFRMFDKDRSGSLNKKEWKKAMKQLGYKFPKGAGKQIFRSIDRDGSGKISEREFCEFWVTTR